MCFIFYSYISLVIQLEILFIWDMMLNVSSDSDFKEVMSSFWKIQFLSWVSTYDELKNL